MKKERKEIKKQTEIRGITLVALVVTIVVLIILATISINIIFGEEGILSKSRQAKEHMSNAEIEEQTALNEMYKDAFGEHLPENTKDTDAGTIVKTPSGWYQETPVYVSTEDGSIVKASTKVASVYAVATGNGETVPVPKGFYYVGGTIASGVVISDNEADKNKYAEDEDGDIPTGVAYNADGTVNEANSELKGNQFVWIPCEIENYKKESFGKTNASGWDTLTNTAEKIQIKKYSGFYVGRYEAGTSDIVLANDVKFENGLTNASSTSNMQNPNFTSSKVVSGKITSKAGEIPYYYADYTTAVQMSEEMYNTNYVKSGLITGTMWDMIMKYITTDSSSYSDLKETKWRNYNSDTGVVYTAGQGRYMTVNSAKETSDFIVADNAWHYGIRTTASSEDVKRNNLYDLAGNLWEWTQEYSTTSSYINRGGSFKHSSSGESVYYRGNGPVNSPYMNYGFRSALYIM